jgi:hypothetical protein
MSFSLFITAVDDRFTEAEILGAFGNYISPHPHGGLRVHYDAEHESVIDCTFDAERTTDGFSVDRPCAHLKLFQALHGLLSARRSFMTYPEDELVCIVTTDASADAVRKHHPELAAALRFCETPEDITDQWSD